MTSAAWTALQEQLKTSGDSIPARCFTRRQCDAPEEIGIEIATRLINGESLNAIIKSIPGVTPGMVYWWLSGGQEGGAAGVLAANYARIREAQAARIGQTAIEIIDQAARGEGDHRAQRVALDGARWITGRLDRTRWSDNVNVQHSGSVTLDAIVTEAQQQRSSLLDRARGRVIEGEAEDITPKEAGE